MSQPEVRRQPQVVLVTGAARGIGQAMVDRAMEQFGRIDGLVISPNCGAYL